MTVKGTSSFAAHAASTACLLLSPAAANAAATSSKLEETSLVKFVNPAGLDHRTLADCKA